MNLSLIGKIKIIFQYSFSSFLSIEIFLFSLLLCFLLFLNLRRKNNIIGIVAIGMYLGFLIGIMITYSDYAQMCFNHLTKAILNYIYFPSTIMYFFIMVFVTIFMLYSVFSKKLSHLKKKINYVVFSILYFFFMSFVALSAYQGVDLSNVVELYQNEVILSIVQISNFILLIWILYTLFYYLYRYYKRKFD